MNLSKLEVEALYKENQKYISFIVYSFLTRFPTFQYMKEDLESECALKFLDLVKTFDEDKSKFSTYLFTNLTFLCQDYLKREARQGQQLQIYVDTAQSMSEESYELCEFRDLVEGCELTLEEQDVLWRIYGLGETVREIARDCSVSHTQILKVRDRAHEKIKRNLEVKVP